MNKPEWMSIAIGFITCMLIGAREPAFCIVQTKLAIVYISDILIFVMYVFFYQWVFQECDRDEQKRQVTTCVLIYLGLGFLSLIAHSLQVPVSIFSFYTEYSGLLLFRVMYLLVLAKVLPNDFVRKLFELFSVKILLILMKPNIAPVHYVHV
jgi:hypothetical protein